MAKLRYFIKRIRGKNKNTEYFWQCKPLVAEKYQVEKFKSLGRDEKEALIQWQELNAKLQFSKNHLKEKGILPFQNIKEIKEGTLKHLSEIYFQERKFLNLAERTKKNYRYMADRLVNKILFEGQPEPLANLKVKEIDRLFCKKLYEKLLPKGKVMAKELMGVLHNILTTAIDYGYLNGESPCTKMNFENNKGRSQNWPKEEFKQFCDTALEKGYNGLFIAMNLAYYTAQRQTDILNLKWSQIDENSNTLTIIQSKTKSIVRIPLNKLEVLKNLLKNLPRKGEYIVIDEFDEKPYNQRTRLFIDRFHTIRKLSKIREELTFRDLRRTAILALDEAGCTESEIASISGHSRATISKMLEIYAPKTITKAESAFDKLNQRNNQN
jgi:integrase